MSYELVRDLIDQESWQEALMELDPLMEAEPENPLGLFFFGQIMLGSEKPSIALTIFKRVTELEPNRPEGWINYGKAVGELHKYDLEEKYFRKALSLSKEGDLTKYLATKNLGTSATHICNPDKAIHWANKALKIEDNPQSHIDLGFAYLQKFDFKRGWAEYEHGMGVHKHRDIKQYANEPQWNGEPGKYLVIYGEQGLGDQILFSEAVRDARRISKQVILHVNPKLKNLMSRSFILETHGYGADNNRAWANDREITASCSMSSLQRIMRSDGYSGKPYLIPDPRRVCQWDALLSTLGNKLNVGIAWSGGVHDTQVSARSTELETLLPLLKTDVNWISLEYKDKSEEIEGFYKKHGIRIHDYSWGTQTSDYDDTAALVSQLDLVIAVPTTAVHLAGSLGIPCWCVVNPYPNFVFGIEGDSMPFYNSVKLFRRTKDWNPVIEQIKGELDGLRHNLSRRAGASRDIQASDGISTGGFSEQGTIREGQYTIN